MRDDQTSAFAELEKDVEKAYEVGVTMEEGERLAAKFLRAMMQVSSAIRTKSLDARMKKNGYKTLRASAYLTIVQGNDKKPTETHISAMLDTDKDVIGAQDVYERADEDNLVLERLFAIFKEAHLYFRGVGRGHST